jgi:two-component system chemotaxis sensor kinase CheA
MQFNDILAEMSKSQSVYKENIKTLFDSLPEWLEELNSGKSVKDIRQEINSSYSGLFNTFDSFETNLKTIVGSFRNTSANLARNTSDLHEAILRIRMVPISQIFGRFPRLVRDLSKSLNKKVDLIINGEDTELDKSVTEELLDPLMHCIRNSLDHGIESADVRRKAGKPETGRLLLKASNEGNMIIIEISDDGAGIDVDKVRRKAIDRGIIHPSKTLSDVEAYNLIFEPGFSTSSEVTNISGRGVGLDVVRKQIEKLNGSVTVWSKPGEGTQFIIKLPLTLAIIQGLLVRVGQEIYALPITSVVESLRIKPEEIKIIDNHEVFNVRDDVISLLRLGKIFRIESDENPDYNYIVIVGSGDKKMGLMVDSLIGEEDVVIKPLKDRYTNSPGIAGATILGDGTVSLIIDVSQLLDLSVKKEQEARQKRIFG